MMWALEIIVNRRECAMFPRASPLMFVISYVIKKF